MKTLVLAICSLCLAGAALAHEADMPLVVHAAKHGWMLLVVIALAAILAPLLRRRH